MLEKNLENRLKKIGDFGEDKAEKFLIQRGYKIIFKNFYTKFGEIDIIAKKKKEIIFCEVKTRTNLKFGMPSESVNCTKKKHMVKVANYFLYKYNLFDSEIRFDVIEIYIHKNSVFINHIKDII